MRVTREDADQVARLLKKKCPRIRGVELFGSTLRKGYGHDIDVVLVVDEQIARVWWQDAGEELRVRMGTSLQPLRRFIKTVFPLLDELTIRTRKARRQARASELLGIDLTGIGNEYRPGIIIDAFLLPENWRNGTSINLDVVNGLAEVIRNDRKTRSFLASIAERAHRVA